jgi:hypothetical protein
LGLRDLGINAVGAEVQGDHVAEVFGAVGEHGGAHVVEELGGHSVGMPGGLHDHGHGRADERRLGDALGAVAADVAGDDPAAGGVTDQDGVGQVQGFPRIGLRRLPSDLALDAGEAIVENLLHQRSTTERSTAPRCIHSCRASTPT